MKTRKYVISRKFRLTQEEIDLLRKLFLQKKNMREAREKINEDRVNDHRPTISYTYFSDQINQLNIPHMSRSEAVMDSLNRRKNQPRSKRIKKQKPTTIEHSYACAVLKQNGFRVFREVKKTETEILTQSYPIKPYQKYKTLISVGDNLVNQYLDDEIKIIDMDYSYLKKWGWKISKEETSGEDFAGQKIRYFLTPIHSHHEDYQKIPPEHRVEIDLKNQMIQFIGKNVSFTGSSGWIQLRPKPIERIMKKPNPLEMNGLFNFCNEEMNDLFSPYFKQQNTRIMEIPEIVIGVTENQEICCIPNTKDAPVIDISGARGSGKTYLENSLECGFYVKYDYGVVNFNDIKGDTQTRCLPWDKSHPYYKELLTFKENNLQLPYVYLTPVLHGLKDKNVLYKDEVGFTVSLPFKELMTDTSNLIRYNPEWKLSDKSQKYINDLIFDDKGKERKDGLINKKNLDEIDIFLEKSISPKIAGLREAVYRVIKDLWNRDILDKTSKINSYWRITKGEREYNLLPWNACLKMGLIPSLMTKSIRNESLFVMWIKFVLESIFRFVNDKDYKGYIMLCGDELVQILRVKETRAIIDQVIREGRTEKIGFTQVVQYRKDIPESISTNSTHHFVFKTTSGEDWKIVRKFGLKTNTEIKEIGRLKQFQCYGFGDFVLYDMNGNKYSNEGEPVKIIKLKPPNVQNYGGK